MTNKTNNKTFAEQLFSAALQLPKVKGEIRRNLVNQFAAKMPGLPGSARAQALSMARLAGAMRTR